MSDRDDDIFDFFNDDDDDPFGADDDLDGLDDDFGELGDDFNFDDDLGDFEGESDLFAADDDFGDDFDFGDDEADVTFDDDFAETSEGPSRTFILVAVVMIIILLAAFGLIVAIVLGGRGPNDRELTATSIVQTNIAVQAALDLTSTRNALDMEATQTADAFTDTPSPTPTASDTPTATPDTSLTQTAVFRETLDAANAEATSVAADATATFFAILTTEPDIIPGEGIDELAQTATAIAGGVAEVPEETEAVGAVDPTDGSGEGTEVAVVSTETGDGTGDGGTDNGTVSDIQMTETALAALGQGGGFATPTQETVDGGLPTARPTVSGNAVALTATALAEILNPPAVTQVPGGGDGGGAVVPTVAIGVQPPDNQLPDTGLFDDIFAGNPAIIFGAALSLLAVIGLSRVLRSKNRKRD